MRSAKRRPREPPIKVANVCTPHVLVFLRKNKLQIHQRMPVVVVIGTANAMITVICRFSLCVSIRHRRRPNTTWVVSIERPRECATTPQYNGHRSFSPPCSQLTDACAARSTLVNIESKQVARRQNTVFISSANQSAVRLFPAPARANPLLRCS